jgi:acyl carrier protein
MTHPRTPESLHTLVLDAVRSLLEDKSLPLEPATPLIGDQSVLDSMRLVELCLLLEDAARDQGFEFDWTSDSAMSRSRSMFRSVGALSQEFAAQAAGRQE